MKKTITSTVVALAVLLLAVRSAQAIHVEYLQADPNRMYPLDSRGLEDNFVMYWWALGGMPVLYWADNSQGMAFPGEVNRAVLNWNDPVNVPKLTFSQRYTQSQADLSFWLVKCPGEGLHICYSVQDAFYDATREGNYVLKAYIYFDPAITYLPSRVGGLAHEVGHVVGLGERYDENNVQCNMSEYTVMDAALIPNPNEPNTWRHCDELTFPATIDVNRTNTYWSVGSLTHWSVSTIGSTQLRFDWEDEAWAETYHNVRVYYYDQVRGVWIQYFSIPQYTDDLGIHRTRSVRRLWFTVAPSLYKVPRGVQHMACGNPYYLMYDMNSTFTCSPPITL